MLDCNKVVNIQKIKSKPNEHVNVVTAQTRVCVYVIVHNCCTQHSSHTTTVLIIFTIHLHNKHDRLTHS